MIAADENLYRQEIEELTDFIRADDNWCDLRSILIVKGFKIGDTLLVSFYEDDRDMEYGVIVTRDKRIFEYSRSTMKGANSIEYFEISEETTNLDIYKAYPQIGISLKLIDEGVL